LIWKNELKGKGKSNGITLAPYLTSVTSIPCILVGLSGYVVCLNALTGEKQWTYSLKTTGYSFVSIYVHGSKIIAASNGKLFIINGDTGLHLLKDELEGLGYEDIGLTMHNNQIDQQSSNLIMYRDVENKRKRNQGTGY